MSHEAKRRGCGARDAVEVYPADADVVNVANMRHLWLVAGELACKRKERRVQGQRITPPIIWHDGPPVVCSLKWALSGKREPNLQGSSLHPQGLL